MKIAVTIKVEDESLRGMLESALYQGSGYWCQPLEAVGDFLRQGHINIKDDEANRKYSLNRERVERGLTKLAKSKTYAHHWQAIVQEEDDQVTHDVLLQFCLFGDVKYS